MADAETVDLDDCLEEFFYELRDKRFGYLFALVVCEGFLAEEGFEGGVWAVLHDHVDLFGALVDKQFSSFRDTRVIKQPQYIVRPLTNPYQLIIPSHNLHRPNLPRLDVSTLIDNAVRSLPYFHIPSLPIRSSITNILVKLCRCSGYCFGGCRSGLY